MNELEKALAALVSGAAADTEWTFEEYRRNLRAADQRLGAAELLLQRALDGVRSHRKRVRDCLPASEAQNGLPPEHPMPRALRGPRDTSDERPAQQARG